jgi:membrane fusion protein, multidrug efflux system
MLIDTRTWWVIANFRETELHRIQPGMHADVYVMSQPHQRLDGVVDSLAFGVTPDPSLVGTFSQGLPDVQRSLNWVHLATRFPVRVRVMSTSPEPLRLGASATVVLGGNPAPPQR